jgi:hypothetical protein
MADQEIQLPEIMTKQEFVAFLERNGQFHERVAENLAELTAFPEQRYDLALKSALLSTEYGSAAFVLISNKFYAPGYTLLRTQFETLVRGIWFMYAASDTWIEKFCRPLTEETADAVKDALMVDKMLKGLRSSESAPQALLGQLESCRDVIWKALNSYNHGGFHPLARFQTGYPLQLSYDVLRNSNTMVALASQLAAIVTGDRKNMDPVRSLHTNFADCLPIISLQI